MSASEPDYLRKLPVPFVVAKAVACDGGGDDLELVYLNEAAAALAGADVRPAGASLLAAFPGVGRDLPALLGETARTGDERCFTCRTVAGDRYFSVHAYRPCEGYCACVLQDVTEHARLERRSLHERRLLEHQAMRDPLTGLYHVRQGRLLVERALAEPRWNGQRSALFMFDVDDFKKVNDEHGHHRGDEVLRGFARLLERSFRRDDVVFRAGGDEFSAFVADMPCACVAERICAEVVAGVERLSAQGVPVSVSVGAAVGGPGRTYESYYRSADRALYGIKRAGKSAYRVAVLDADPVFPAGGVGADADPALLADSVGERVRMSSSAPTAPARPQPAA